MIEILRKEGVPLGRDDAYIVLNGHGTLLPEPIQVVKKQIPVLARKMETAFTVETVEGVMRGKPGDYLMTGIDGEMYPCDAGIFDRSYDRIDNDPDWVDSEVMDTE